MIIAGQRLSLLSSLSLLSLLTIEKYLQQNRGLGDIDPLFLLHELLFSNQVVTAVTVEVKPYPAQS